VSTRPRLRLDTLLELLDLQEIAAADGSWSFDGIAHPATLHNRVFGGLLLAQALVAAGRTVPTRLAPMSVQADFVRGVPAEVQLRYAVRRLFDAKAMAGRVVSVTGADGDVLFSATVRFSDDKPEYPSYTSVRPRTVPGPDGLADLSQRFIDVPEVPAWWAMERPIEFRHVEDPPYLEPTPEADRQTIWFTARGQMPHAELMHAAMLAYVSDMSILEPAFRKLGATRLGGERILSVNHSLWFHRPTDVTEWHQLDQWVPAMSHGRTLGHATVFDRAGSLIASVSQLGLVRAPPSG